MKRVALLALRKDARPKYSKKKRASKRVKETIFRALFGFGIHQTLGHSLGYFQIDL